MIISSISNYLQNGQTTSPPAPSGVKPPSTVDTQPPKAPAQKTGPVMMGRGLLAQQLLQKKAKSPTPTPPLDEKPATEPQRSKT